MPHRDGSGGRDERPGDGIMHGVQQEMTGEASQTGVGADRLGWPAAALAIVGLSVLCWTAVVALGRALFG